MEKDKRSLPRYQRTINPPSMRLTERDKHILEAVHSFDGLLSFSQIQRLFFTCKSQAERRMMLLYQHKYINRPSFEERRRLPEMVYWLDKRGAEIVASLEGTAVQDFAWRREPRWFQVEHDLAVNRFRMDLMEACRASSNITLETWVPESEFWAYPDRVTYVYCDHEMKRFIRPDGFFILNTGDHRIRYLLEIDRSTEDNPRFLREKVLPGLAYIRDKAYESRFGHRSGRWLVVTTGERRLRNMLQQARKGDTKGLFYFTTYDRLNVKSILLSPIWQRTDRTELVPLLFLD